MEQSFLRENDSGPDKKWRTCWRENSSGPDKKRAQLLRGKRHRVSQFQSLFFNVALLLSPAKPQAEISNNHQHSQLCGSHVIVISY
ncbi:hypothetical protein T11_6587 [Trichinella zimbabwensis]|uniref:Uncharacterized protein n=1 Tax=Trichinella zimbabwensis TaxID=268475 RepID=A0A0V1HKM1_9BILA|nr:hypothetical protein T11_6587 [Trichinella zimbabwensis]